MKAFDRKFGTEFFGSIPAAPGAYRMYQASGRLIYVGKAKNLRRRLGQYRNARRTKHDRKMRSIIADTARIEWEVCASDLEACLLETRLIQAHRPKWNVAGAFSFLYPLVGLCEESGRTLFCLTTVPERLPEFRYHGAFRSREITGEAFFALIRLLKYVGHVVPRKQLDARAGEKYSYVFAFRQLPRGWAESWGRFFAGDSSEVMESLVLALLENAGARSQAAQVQEDINALRRFWKHEALLLHRARLATGYAEYPVPQKERDLLFLRYRDGRRQEKRPVAAVVTV